MSHWEYLFLELADASGYFGPRQWKAKYVNGQQLAFWKDGPSIHEYCNQLGKQGWEIVAVNTPFLGADRITLKRLKVEVPAAHSLADADWSSDTNSDLITCGKCGLKQLADRTVCWQCGTPFPS